MSSSDASEPLLAGSARSAAAFRSRHARPWTLALLAVVASLAFAALVASAGARALLLPPGNDAAAAIAEDRPPRASPRASGSLGRSAEARAGGDLGRSARRRVARHRRAADDSESSDAASSSPASSSSSSRARARKPSKPSPATTGAPQRSASFVEVPGRHIKMLKAPGDSRFCPMRSYMGPGGWKGKPSGFLVNSSVGFTWPSEEGIRAARRACKTPTLQRLQDSGAFIDAFCFILRPPRPDQVVGRVDFDVDPVCASSYNFNKDVVPGAPAFLEAAARFVTCDVTTVVGMYDLDGHRDNKDYEPIGPEVQRELMEDGTVPLFHQTSFGAFDGNASEWMPDFYFLRSHGFEENAFGDVTLDRVRSGTNGGARSSNQETIGGRLGGGEVTQVMTRVTPPPPPRGHHHLRRLLRTEHHASRQAEEAAKMEEEAALDATRYAWRAKRRSVFWRGSPTGRGECADMDRVKLAKMARHIEGLDAGIVEDGNSYFCPSDVLERLGVRLLPSAPESEWVNHRAVIDVDGVGNAWGRYWRLASDSVVLSLETPIAGFYSARMEPWVHYVPATLETLAERVRWILDDDNEDAQVEMIRAANVLAASVTFGGEAERLGRALDAKMCGGQPERELRWEPAGADDDVFGGTVWRVRDGVIDGADLADDAGEEAGEEEEAGRRSRRRERRRRRRAREEGESA